MSSRFYSSGRKRSSEKTAWTASRKLSKEGERTIPTRAFLLVYHFSNSLSLSRSLISLWCPIHFHLYLLSLPRPFFPFLLLSLSRSQSHAALHIHILFLSPLLSLSLFLLFLANYQIKEHPAQSFFFWYNECSPSLEDPSLNRQFQTHWVCHQTHCSLLWL